MKSPCVKECPDRSATCRLECEKFKEYRKQKEAEYEERHKTSLSSYVLNDYEIKNSIRINRRKRK